MDAKLNQTRIPGGDTHAQQAAKKRRSWVGSLQELKNELKRVSWTEKEELKLSTKVVVGSIFFFGLGIYLVDLLIKGCLDFIALLFHFIFG